MIFGDKSRFAIDISLDQNYGGAWLFGKFFYWINNRVVGNKNSSTSLRDILPLMKFIPFDNGRRGDSRLEGLPLEECFKVIDDAIYEEGVDWLDCPSRFKLNMDVDVFNATRIYLLDEKERTRLMFKVGNEPVEEFFIKRGEFDILAKSAFEYVDLLYEKEIKE